MDRVVWTAFLFANDPCSGCLMTSLQQGYWRDDSIEARKAQRRRHEEIAAEDAAAKRGRPG